MNDCVVLLNGKREVKGVLRGFDQFMNLVLDDAQEIVSDTQKNDIGVVVIRGNSIIQMELLEISTIWDDVMELHIAWTIEQRERRVSAANI